MTTVGDAQRLLTQAAAHLRHLTDGDAAQPGFTGLAIGLRMPAMPRTTDDGRPDQDPRGPAVLPTPDDADRALRNVARYAERIARDVEAITHELHAWRRLGLPRTHPDRAPTPDERAASQGQVLADGEVCKSCIRIGIEVPRSQRSTLCRWCRGIVTEYGPRWPQMVSHGMPPINLVTLHHDQEMGRARFRPGEIEEHLTIAFGTPRRIETIEAETAQSQA